MVSQFSSSGLTDSALISTPLLFEGCNHCHIFGTRTPYLSRPPSPTRSMLFTNRKSANSQGVWTLCFPTLIGGKGVCVGQRPMTLIVDNAIHRINLNN